MSARALSPTVIARQLLIMISKGHPGGDLTVLEVPTESAILLEANFGGRTARFDCKPFDLALGIDKFAAEHLERAVRVLTGALPSEEGISPGVRGRFSRERFHGGACPGEGHT